MNMTFALLARFNNPVVPLRDVCKEFFGVNPKTAEQHAKAGKFPIPTFKMRDSERAPTFVNVNDLADYLQAQYDSARAEWERVQS
ncbi:MULTISPECIES: pyocin activator PrtN family protein [Pseudoalteromonas]|uniref:Pyocin activator protein PrtN n=1 Tax=Pseudoalteromonas piscicida TaxID=43662 RepID=A0AAD0RLJ2_PSEO7|nr:MULTISPECIES: pyocin activator PrtN family protein [Pseudoalteromonas]ASD68511.1 pyocin activator protein PrtN [Pseudoalteromonas piscicida]AXR03566.1 pyocin activator protein PrtN [Pseudoalteromonas piscicida]PHI36324.1 pyocin activator protein PrtN [Pseudoalteromonas sp. GCY]QQQ66916.1 pyocin activator PrtN family protein [Pseudoalteromonas sp. GCY]